MEKLFDHNDVAKRPKLAPVGEGVEECNIGTTKHQKIIKLSKILSPEMKKTCLELKKTCLELMCFPQDTRT